jgi:hypothetical protein
VLGTQRGERPGEMLYWLPLGAGVSKMDLKHPHHSDGQQRTPTPCCLLHAHTPAAYAHALLPAARAHASSVRPRPAAHSRALPLPVAVSLCLASFQTAGRILTATFGAASAPVWKPSRGWETRLSSGSHTRARERRPMVERRRAAEQRAAEWEAAEEMAAEETAGRGSAHRPLCI